MDKLAETSTRIYRSGTAHGPRLPESTLEQNEQIAKTSINIWSSGTAQGSMLPKSTRGNKFIETELCTILEFVIYVGVFIGSAVLSPFKTQC